MAELHNSKYEESQASLETLTDHDAQNIADRNEATTRLHLILLLPKWRIIAALAHE